MKQAKTLIREDKDYASSVKIIKPSDKVDEQYGCYTFKVSEEQIEALKNGDVASIDIGNEYTILVYSERKPKKCEFCKTIIPEEDADDRAFCQGKYKGCREENFIWRDKDDGAFCIEAPSGDPYEVGLVCNIKYCPYCGRKLESEDKQ